MARDSHRLSRLFAPRSIAFVGGVIAEMSIRRSLELGYDGKIWPVHPTRETMEGFRCYRSISELPGVPDAAHIGVNRHATIGILEELAQAGTGGCVCYAAGYAEMGEEGAELERRLVAAAGDMPLIGPNTFGFLNFLDRVALWPYLFGCEPAERGVAIISQSGNIAMNLSMNDRSLEFTHIIGTGNQSMVGQGDLIEALLEDDRVRAIGMYIEGIDDMARFSRAAVRALRQGVPIVVLKAGRTEISARQSSTHTHSLAGSDSLHDALFRRLGIIRVNDLEGLLETLKAMQLSKPFSGRNLLSLSCSGGEAAIMADLVADHGLETLPFPAALEAELNSQFEGYVTVSNPFDYNTSIWGDGPALERCFTAALSGDHDAAVLVWDHPNSTDPAVTAEIEEWEVTLDAYLAACRATGKPAFMMSSIAECLPDAARRRLRHEGIVPLQGMQGGVAAIAAVADYHAFRDRHDGEVSPPRPFAPPADVGSRWLDEADSKEWLASFGLTVPEGRTVIAAEAPGAAKQLGFPVVVKAVGADFLHKSELGAVQVGLRDADAVAKAVRAIVESCRGQGLAPDRFLVEQMIEGGVAELIIGIKRDPQFGPALVIGAGGVLVELVQDSVSLILPVNRDMVREALTMLSVNKLLNGYRGAPAGDLDACVEAVCAVADFAMANWDALCELDVNPLIVLPEGQGAVAADALICLDDVAGRS